ncbi:MAG: wax ester/triacylglycerol synthase family O-acyltransferase [Myxococcota bacterium]
MARYGYERLSAQDAGFLWAETPNQPMHVGAVAVFEIGPLVREDGGVDIERYRAQVESRLHWIPRYRQKIEWTPFERWPVWVDDRNFDIAHHIRHIALPRPGTQAQLKEIVARINARRLDRRHALWEVWVIEGVEGGKQFAILNKIHHCMIDGAAGADLSQVLMTPSSRVEDEPTIPYLPRPAPTRAELLGDALSESVRRPLALARDWISQATSSPAQRASMGQTEISTAERLRAFVEVAGQVTTAASPTPMNGELGPHRRLDWLTMPLEDVKELRRELGCTINDVVLATVTGALRRYLFRRRMDVKTLDFRIAAPVSTRRPEHERIQGNHVSTWVVPLPLALDDPIEQVEAIQATTEELKSSKASLAAETIMDLAEWVPAPLLERALPAISSSGPVNMIVTNVPGPQIPLYLAGARLLAMYPVVPLIPGGGLGVALFSYEGKLCWGFNGDFELVPDLSSFVEDVSAAFEDLRKATVERYLGRRTGPAVAPEPVEAPAADAVAASEASDESDASETSSDAAPAAGAGEAAPSEAAKAETPARSKSKAGSGSPAVVNGFEPEVATEISAAIGR